MSWKIEEQERVVLVSMNSNPVNKMNPNFFDDLDEAWDRIERESSRLPVVLTGVGNTFSAGLDFEDVFPRFAHHKFDEIMAWFGRFRSVILRVFTAPRPIVGAINGHAFAGGLILALCCDWRIAADNASKLSLNEVAIGIPMPGTFTEIIRYAVGSRIAAEATLHGRVYNVREAYEKGFVHEVVNPLNLVETSIRKATEMSHDCFDAYVISKQALLAPILKTIESEGFMYDQKAMQGICLPSSTRAQANALAMLKQRQPKK